MERAQGARRRRTARIVDVPNCAGMRWGTYMLPPGICRAWETPNWRQGEG
jgi:hypothetical protein